MPRFTVELKVTLDMDIEMAPEEAARIDLRALHDDIAFQAEDAISRQVLLDIQDRVDEFTGWVSSASTLSVEAKRPSKKYLETLLTGAPA